MISADVTQLILMESLSLYVNGSEIGISLQSQLTHLPSRFSLSIRARGQFRAGIFILFFKKTQLFVVKKSVGDMTTILTKGLWLKKECGGLLH